MNDRCVMKTMITIAALLAVVGLLIELCRLAETRSFVAAGYSQAVQSGQTVWVAPDMPLGEIVASAANTDLSGGCE